MPTPPMFVPPKPCEWCGKLMERPRFSNGQLEAPTMFARRRFCSQSCAASRPFAKKNSMHKRARKHRGDHCEACGTTKRLQAHHLDQDFTNNALNNIQTLCKSCHDFWHNTARRLGREIAGRMPRIV